MYSLKLALFAVLFSAAARWTVHALTPKESDFLKVARAAADNTYGQDTLHEDVSFKFTMDGLFTLFGARLTVETIMTENRAQRKNAAGGHDVYARTTSSGTFGGFPAASYVMDELVLDGEAWAKLVEGAYDTEVPLGWFKPAEHGMDDLESEVLDQAKQATGAEVKESLLDENAKSVKEVAAISPNTRCFQVTPTAKFKGRLVGDEMEGDAKSLNEKANIHQTFCVQGGFLIGMKMSMHATGYSSVEATDANAVAFGGNTYSQFGDPVYIPDPRAY